MVEMSLWRLICAVLMSDWLRFGLGRFWAVPLFARCDLNFFCLEWSA